MSRLQIEVIFTDSHVNRKSIYQSGQALPLALKVRLPQSTSCCIYARIYGECCVSWLERSVVRNTSVRTKEVHLDRIVTVFSSELPHPPGQMLYPVDFQLPASTPSSFVGEFGHIRYYVMAGLERRERRCMRSQKPFTVVHTQTLSSLPMELVGGYSMDEAIPVKCCLCCGCCRGWVRARVCLAKRGYAAGDQIGITGEIRNNTSTLLESVCLRLEQQSTFFAGSKYRLVNRATSSIELGSVGQGQSLMLSHQLTVHASLPTYFLEGCHNIKVHHFLLLLASGGCCWTLKKQLCELIIGTVPVESGSLE